jgi:hypothetical protein
MEVRPLEPRAPVRDHGVSMARRKQFADLEQLQDVKPPASVPEPEIGKENDEEEERKDLPESILQLQGAIGNRALSRALLERFALPGAAEAELPGPEAAGLPGMQPEKLGVGVDDLMGRSPADQVSVFMNMAEALPPEAQELVHTANRVVSGSSSGKMDAHVLKALAHSKLGPIPPGSKVTNAPALIDQLCEAVSFAWNQWQVMAFFKNVIIQGPLALLGEIEGPPLGPFVLSMAGGSSGPEGEAAQAVAGALDDGMKEWQATPKFPGLPLYPAFAALPMPQAAPMPNLPVPVASLIGGALPPRMSASGRASDPGAEVVAQAVLEAVTGGAFELWAGSTLVINLLAHGPVPSFAPPYVPVGPVVGGTVLPLPGVLL